MDSRARAAALLPVWALVGAAAATSTLVYSAVAGSRGGCVEAQLANLFAVGAVAGLGLALAALLLVAAVPLYRAAVPAVCAGASFVLSAYAVITFLSHDRIVCGL